MLRQSIDRISGTLIRSTRNGWVLRVSRWLKRAGSAFLKAIHAFGWRIPACAANDDSVYRGTQVNRSRERSTHSPVRHLYEFLADLAPCLIALAVIALLAYFAKLAPTIT